MKFASLGVAAFVTAVAAPAAFAQTAYKKDMPDSLVKRAKITEAAASATAQKRVPKGKIEGVELEVENGKLMYSYDVKTEGKSGTDEVNISALTGKIIGFAHESAATEKKEAAADAKAAKAAKPKKP
jgi:peptidase YpeB-like protein